MISLFFSIIGIFFWLAIEIASIAFVIALDICTLIVNGIISLIGICLCGTASAGSSKPVVSSKPLVTYKPVKNNPVQLSRHERKAIEKSVKKEIRRAQDDLEYDMLMMAEVFSDY